MQQHSTSSGEELWINMSQRQTTCMTVVIILDRQCSVGWLLVGRLLNYIKKDS